jgi:MoaA/NifB/PqqE/SkfB family radical SAM enzyme
MDIVDQLIEVGVFKVGLGGGEPLIRRDCMLILEKLGEAHVDTNVTTNGWFLDEAITRRFLDIKLGTLYVSLDNVVAEEHDAFRRKPGSFDRAVQGISTAVGAGLNVKLSTVIVLTNVNRVREFVEFGERMGVAGVEFKRFRPAGNGVARIDDYSLLREQESMLHSELAKCKEHSYLDIQLIYGAEPDGRTDAGCPCGIRSICLRPNGDVAPCAYSEKVVGNLTADRLSDLWRYSPDLKALRQARSCSALIPNLNPSNPLLSGH